MSDEKPDVLLDWTSESPGMGRLRGAIVAYVKCPFGVEESDELIDAVDEIVKRMNGLDRVERHLRTRIAELEAKAEVNKETTQELLAEYRKFIESTKRYIQAHTFMGSRFQDADRAEEYKDAAKALYEKFGPGELDEVLGDE